MKISRRGAEVKRKKVIRRRPISPFSYVGQGRKVAKVKTTTTDEPSVVPQARDYGGQAADLRGWGAYT
jgi:hypothetical protein